MVLAGDFARPPYAADLFHQGLAAEVWLSRPAPYPAEDRVRELGIRFPLEEDVNREILVRRGVPAGRIRLYGRAVLSTVHEARSLAAEYAWRGKRILVVTSRFHARRSRWIFRRELPGADIRVVATPYDEQPGRWWQNKFMAQWVVLEAMKAVYWALGGRFVTIAPQASGS